MYYWGEVAVLQSLAEDFSLKIYTLFNIEVEIIIPHTSGGAQAKVKKKRVILSEQ